MRSSRFAVAAAPFIVLGLAACSPAGSTSSTPTAKAAATSAAPPVSAAARFAAAADQVCAVQNQREDALGNGLINADIVTVAHLPKAAHYLEKVVAIKRDGLPELHQLAATGPAADQAEQQAFVRAFQNVVTDYQDAALAASRGDMTAFRADFDRVAPHGYPTGPDARALDRATAPFPFKACGKGDGI